MGLYMVIYVDLSNDFHIGSTLAANLAIILRTAMSSPSWQRTPTSTPWTCSGAMAWDTMWQPGLATPDADDAALVGPTLYSYNLR